MDRLFHLKQFFLYPSLLDSAHYMLYLIPSEGRTVADSLGPVGEHQTVFFHLHRISLPKSWDRSKVQKEVFQAVGQSLERSHKSSLAQPKPFLTYLPMRRWVRKFIC